MTERIRIAIGIASLVLMGTLVLAQTFGTKKRMPKPYEFGRVTMDGSADARKGVTPVVFEHWLHRAKFTCRFCHVDLGFAMTTNATGVLEDDNRNGLYCGACHNGKSAFDVQDEKRCVSCHSQGKSVDFKYDFYSFVKGFPRSRFGNKVDWMKAEEMGLIDLVDYVEGVSIKRAPLAIPKNSQLNPKIYGIPDVMFSHEKHAVWNGCELCHPEIFGVNKGRTQYEMQDIFDGRFCGACHGKVAFMNMDCQLCHTKPVN